MKVQTTAAFVVQTASGQFRAVATTMPLLENEIIAALPHLCGSHSAAIGLTYDKAVLRDTVMDGLLAAGWQSVNFVFTGGLWYKAEDLLGTLGIPLGCEPEMATEEQLQLVYRITKSHVFDADRYAIRTAADRADAEQCSKIISTVIREVKRRKDEEKHLQFSYAQAA